jgi:anti-sigma-K factor RskA
VERRLTFTVVQPTVTPTTPPPRPSPTRVEEEGEVASTATPSPTPLNPLGDRLTVWRLVGALAIVATVSLLVAGWRLIHK